MIWIRVRKTSDSTWDTDTEPEEKQDGDRL